MSTFLSYPVFGFKWAKSVYLCGFPSKTKARHFVKWIQNVELLCVCIYDQKCSFWGYVIPKVHQLEF